MFQAERLYADKGAKTPNTSTRSRPEHRDVSRRTVIEAAKEAVPTIDLANLLCGPGELRRVGSRWVAKCPLPGHGDKTPSFTVYPATDSWYCFGACQLGGDVVDLAAAAWGYGKHEMAMVAANLLHEFGHEIPPRPASWFRRQERQKPVRNGLEEIRVNSLRRRLFRLLEPMISGIVDEEERAREAEYIWREITPLAVRMIEEWRLEREQGRAG
jgi:DNA primase